MSGLIKDGEAAVVDTLADRVVDGFIPDKGGK